MPPKPTVELSTLQILILESLADSSLKNKFYWTGGTALAYFHLHHRLSHDLDFFSSEPFSYEEIVPFIKLISDKAELKRVEEKRIADRWEFFMHNKEKMRIEFVHYDFPPLKPRKKWRGVLIDSLDDMAANKTMALVDRHEPKDAFDLYYLLRRKYFTLQRLLKMAKNKFGVEIFPSQFWSEALAGAQRLTEIKPLLTKSESEKNEKIEETIDYFETQSTRFIKSQI